MALSTELSKRLNSEDEPIRKRLKLAQNAFYANDLPFVRREDLILNWLCKICPDNTKAWTALESCLKQEQLDVKDTVKESLIDIVLQSLTEAEPSSKLLSCCRLLVSNPTMQQYFAREPKALIRLVESMLEHFYESFKRTLCNNGHVDFSNGIDVALIQETGGKILDMYTTLINVVEAVLQIYKLTFSTKEELRSAFVESILYPLCAIIDHKCLDSTNRLGAAAHKCIQQLIFGRRNAQSKNNEGNDKVFELLLMKLKASIESVDIERNIMTFVALYRAAIGVYKDDTAKLDVIFRALVESSGTCRKKITSACLRCMLDLTFDFDHKVDEVSLFAYCQSIVDSAVSQEKLRDTDLKLIVQLTHFNPLIIERKIPDILRKILLRKRRAEWTELMLAILDACVRLRKEEKLVSQMLIALRSSFADEGAVLNVEEFFPKEFIEKFAKTATAITSSQTVVILRTLIYHLNSDCIEILESKNLAKVPMMKAIIELLTAFFDGLCVFEYKGTLQWHEKFVNALEELGNVLATLVDKALQLNYNETITELLLSATESWSKIQAALEYYVPKVATRKSSGFPISEDHWQQLVQRVANFGPDRSKTIMNRLIVRKEQILESAISQGAIKLGGLIGGIEYFWPSLLQHDTEMIPCLKTSELSKLTSLLLEKVLEDNENFEYYFSLLKSDRLQDCRSFVLVLLSNSLIKIGTLLPECTAKSIIEHVNIKHMATAELSGSDRVQKDMKAVMNKHLLQNFPPHSLEKLSKSTLRKIERIMKLLSKLPVAFLTADVRTFTFIIIYVLTEESFMQQQIDDASRTVLAELVDRPGINVLRYMGPPLLMKNFHSQKYSSKAVDLSLRNGVDVDCLTKLADACNSLSDISLLMECFDNTKAKMSAEHKEAIKLLNLRFTEAILSKVPCEIQKDEPDYIKGLTVLVKVGLSNGTLDKRVQCATVKILANIFLQDYGSWKPEVMDAALQLAVLAVRNRKLFEITEETIAGLSRAMLEQPINDLLLPLMESTSKKDFPKILELLHSSMVKSLANTSATDHPLKPDNNLIVWKAILKTDMSAEKNKIRHAAIGRLLEAILTLNVSEKAWLIILKLISNVLSTKHLHLSGSIVDASVQLGLRSVDEVKLIACDDALTICATLITTRSSLITDRLPILLLLYKRIISTVTNASKTTLDSETEQSLRCLAINIEKVTGALIKMKKDLQRLTPYLIADLLELFADATIAVYVKGSLQNCISQLIGVCDQHAIALLSRTLPLAMQEIFKSQVETFNKFYKFSGKI